MNPDHKRLHFLDGMRGLAALYVLLFHARWLLWEGFSEGFVRHPERYTLPGKLAAYGSLLFYYGHQAVLFFFVLSGFVIHLRYSQKLHAGDSAFDLATFLKRRARRIYPPLILALLVTFAFDQAGMLRGLSIYTHQTAYTLINAVSVNYDLRSGLSTLFLIAGTPSWGSNLPLWSLKLEWCFYLLYPAFWWIAKRSMALATAILAIWLGISFLPFMDSFPLLQSIGASMIVWWFGVLLADMYTRRLKIRFVQIAPLGLLLLVLPVLIAPLVQWNTTVQDVAWGLGFSGLLAAPLAWQNRGGSLAWLAKLNPLGALSYTLYVTHFPILFFISGMLIVQSSAGLLPDQYGWVAVGVIVCLGIAYLGHLIVERPFAPRRA